MPWQGIKFSPPYCLIRSSFFHSDLSQQKNFVKRTAQWMFFIYLSRNHLLWAFVAGILWKTQPWNISARSRTAKCTAICNHDGSLEDNYCLPFFKLKLFIPTLGPIFCSPKSSKIYRESDFVSSVSRNKLAKYIFFWFHKRDFYF